MEPTMSERRRAETEVRSERESPAPATDDDGDFPASEKRRLSRSSDDEAFLDPEITSVQRIEELPTEPRHEAPCVLEVDWDAPTVPDGKAPEFWEIDERG